MYSLIISLDGDDTVHISTSKDKLETMALDYIRNNLNDITNFGSDDTHKMLMKTLEINDLESSIEIYSDLLTLQDEMLYMNIVPATIIYDA